MQHKSVPPLVNLTLYATPPPRGQLPSDALPGGGGLMKVISMKMGRMTHNGGFADWYFRWTHWAVFCGGVPLGCAVFPLLAVWGEGVGPK